jgi:cyclophilin family peptidyl-prolyl cis-trans isomerase
MAMRLLDDDRNVEDSKLSLRRKMLTNVGAMAATLGLLTMDPRNAAASVDVSTVTSSSSASASGLVYAYPPITHKVYMDVRISRADGSFYVRDDLPDDTPENQVFQGKLVLGLFGTLAPNHVEQFLKYVSVSYNPTEDDPLPTYARSSFVTLDQSNGMLKTSTLKYFDTVPSIILDVLLHCLSLCTQHTLFILSFSLGLLAGGMIPSLEITEIGGSSALRYGSRILPAPIWYDKIDKDKRVSHSMGKGLLTHRTLDLSPSFGITTRAAGEELDSTHVVFGRLLPDDGDSQRFLQVCQDIRTYSENRPGPTDAPINSPVDDLASQVFSAQRDFFRGAAKTFGDTRISKVYEGKLLRRVEVTQIGLL